MIIIYFLFFSCFSTKETPTFSQPEELRLFGLNDVKIRERALSTTSDIQEKSQLHWLYGIQNNDIESFIVSRGLGISCLQEHTSFQIDQIQHPDIAWKQFSWFPGPNCDPENASTILRIPKTPHHTACVTWTILSWSKILQHYNLDKGSVDADIIFYLAAWLVENESCIESEWTTLAIAIAQLQMEQDPRIVIPQKDLRAAVEKRIRGLTSDSKIREYAQLWYFLHRLRTEIVSQTEKDEWRQILQTLRERGTSSEYEPFISEILQYLNN